MNLEDTLSRVVHVHVDNTEELTRVVATEEVEPEHFTTQSYTLPPVGAQTPQANYNQNVPVQILALDPLRKRANISINGQGQAYICASQAQAQSLQFGPTQNPDQGFLVTAPYGFPAEATGPMWAVAATGIAQSYDGEGEAPLAVTPGETVAALNGGNPIPAGDYVLSGSTMLSGTGTVADINNMALYVGATQVTILPNGDATEVLFPLPGLTFNVPAGGAVVAIKIIAAGSGTANYWASFAATSTPLQSQITVGVMQERRGS